MNTGRIKIFSGLSGALAVALGALGAHALKNKLSTGLITPEQLNGFDTAVKYQMYHTLALLIIVLWYEKNENRFLKIASKLFVIGIFLFSGSLYFLTTRNLWDADWLKILGPITPIGGICFMAGWLCIAYSVFKSKNSEGK